MSYRTQPVLVSDENAFQPAEVGALLLMVALVVAAVAFVPATGWTRFREVAPFMGSAFGAIIAIYGAHKVARIKEIRDRRHAREELLDIVFRANWDFENRRMPEGDGFPMDAGEYALLVEGRTRHVNDTAARLDDLPAIATDRDLPTRRALAEVRIAIKGFQAEVARGEPGDFFERGERIEKLDHAAAIIWEYANMIERSLTNRNKAHWRLPDWIKRLPKWRKSS